MTSRSQAFEGVIASRHYLVEVDRTANVLRMSRTAAPFQSTDEIRKTMDSIVATLESFPKSRFRMLVDLRSGPSRNDPEFELVFRPYRVAVVSGFHRVAVLVATAVGKLQVQRHAREDELPIQVFVNESLAVAFVRVG